MTFMIASAPTPAGFAPAERPAWASASRQIGPMAEGALARASRWIGDRQRLVELDDRLLRDLGLTREDVRRGLPFRHPTWPGAAIAQPIASTGSARREAGDWRFKFHAAAIACQRQILQAAPLALAAYRKKNRA
jgi:uncharacterized protein YjiS (DUF1127 family)